MDSRSCATIFAIIFTSVSPSEQTGSCEGHREYLCNNLNCIYEGFECDGQDDCGDHSDDNCHPQFCGGFLTESSGTTSTPNFPIPYPHNSKCSWIFQGAEGSFINLRFTTFELEQPTTIFGRNRSYCNDWLKILEAKEYGLTDRNGYCGIREPWTLISSGNYLWIQFRSDVEVSGQGFQAEYDIGSSVVTDACSSSPCINGGSCSVNNNDNSYSCKCVRGYTGYRCQTTSDTTLPVITNCPQTQKIYISADAQYAIGTWSPPTAKDLVTPDNLITTLATHNPGQRLQIGTTQVVYIFTDQANNEASCSFAVIVIEDGNDCESQPCYSDGTCRDGIHVFTCTCRPGYVGDRCQTNTNACVSNPCSNGGSCVDGTNSTTCQCVLGYTGDRCETDTNECSSGLCQNGGSCLDAINGFTCKCMPGFNGDTCDLEHVDQNERYTTVGLAIGYTAAAVMLIGFAISMLAYKLSRNKDQPRDRRMNRHIYANGEQQHDREHGGNVQMQGMGMQMQEPVATVGDAIYENAAFGLDAQHVPVIRAPQMLPNNNARRFVNVIRTLNNDI